MKSVTIGMLILTHENMLFNIDLTKSAQNKATATINANLKLLGTVCPISVIDLFFELCFFAVDVTYSSVPQIMVSVYDTCGTTSPYMSLPMITELEQESEQKLTNLDRFTFYLKVNLE